MLSEVSSDEGNVRAGTHLSYLRRPRKGLNLKIEVMSGSEGVSASI